MGSNVSVKYVVTTNQNAMHGSVTQSTTIIWTPTQSLGSWMSDMTAAGINTTFNLATRVVTMKGDNFHFAREYGETVQNGTVYNPLRFSSATSNVSNYNYHRYEDTEFMKSKIKDIASSYVGKSATIYMQTIDPSSQNIVTNALGSFTINDNTTVQDFVNWANGFKSYGFRRS